MFVYKWTNSDRKYLFFINHSNRRHSSGKSQTPTYKNNDGIRWNLGHVFRTDTNILLAKS